eukprot:2932744-Prymnesium_polylepis.2
MLSEQTIGCSSSPMEGAIDEGAQCVPCGEGVDAGTSTDAGACVSPGKQAEARGDVHPMPAKGKAVSGRWSLDPKKGLCVYNGKQFCCEHGRQRCRCKECGGSQICEHGRQRNTCKEC